MNRSLATMTGFGLLGAIFLAALSAVYLKQIPGKTQIAKLQTDLNAEFGNFFDPAEPLQVQLVLPRSRGDAMSLSIRCVLRADLRRTERPLLDELLLAIGERSLRHPAWRGKISTVAVRQESEPKFERVVELAELDELASRGLRAARMPGRR
jgi:hypothetical protein